MKADTFAKLILLETLIDAEVGYYLEHRPGIDALREGMVARVSDLIDEIDALDAVTAARTYDAVVDFLADLPQEGEEGVVRATVRFKRAVDRVVERGMDAGELKQASTWAIALDELLGALTREYRRAVLPDGGVRPREYLRATVLLARAREAADRMRWEAAEKGTAGLADAVDRLTFAVRHQRVDPDTADLLARTPQRTARRHRPSTLTRVGAFVIGQLLRRQSRGARRSPPAEEPA